MARLILVAVLLLTVAACDRFPGLPANETGVLSYDWIPADPRPKPKPLYCYQTLATPECFAQPIPGRQALGLYGPPPAPAPWPPQAAAPAAATPPAVLQPAELPEAPPAPAPVVPVERMPAPLLPQPKS